MAIGVRVSDAYLPAHDRIDSMNGMNFIHSEFK